MPPRTVDDYLKLPYTIEVMYDRSDDHPGWFARVVELPGCITQADTFEELGTMIEDAMRGWIEIGLEDGQPIPEPRPAESHSGKFVVRLPRSLHRQVAEAAERDGVSLNTYISVAIGRAVGLEPPPGRNDTIPPPPHVWRQLSSAAEEALSAAGMQEEILQINEIFRAKIVNLNADSLIIEASGDSEKIAALLGLLEPFGILELARTGRLALKR